MLRALLVGVVAGVVNSNDKEDVGENWNKEEQVGRLGVVLRREQVIRVLFEGKTGTIEEEPVANARPLGTLSLVMENESLHLRDDDDNETVIDLPEWLEQGIDPALRDSDDDAPQVALSSMAPAISSQGVSFHRVPAPAGLTPDVLTPTGESTPKDTKDWRDLNKFYASESESEEEEEDGEGVEEGSGIDEDSDEDEGTSQDEEGVAEAAEHDPGPSHERIP
jgi:AP-3 complex subunit beta